MFYAWGKEAALEKLGFNTKDMRRILSLAKLRTVKMPNARLAALSTPEAKERIAAMASSPWATHPQYVAQMRQHGQLAGSIIAPRRGDLVSTMRTEPGWGSSIKKLTPQDRIGIEAISKGHELDELALAQPRAKQPSMFFDMYHHASPRVILRERNRVLTSDLGNVKDFFTRMRSGSGREAELFERATGGRFQYGTGPRLSRHAQKHIERRMHELTGGRYW